MVFNQHYLIDPRPELRPQLERRLASDDVDWLMEPVELEHPEYDRSSLRPAHHLIIVKLLFLAHLRDFDTLSSDEKLKAILGSARISVELFDRWWTIRALPGYEDEDIAMNCLIEHLSSVDRTGVQEVDDWLDSIGRR